MSDSQGSIIGTVKNGFNHIIIDGDLIELSGNPNLINIDVSSLANNSVSTVEFQYLSGVTSSIQTQLDNMISSVGGSSSLLIDNSTNATSNATRTAQAIGSGLFYQNGTELRVQYKTSNSNFQDILIGAFDLTSPVITILGDNPVEHPLNTTYTDAGATASDNTDGDVTSAIETTGTVDTTTIGPNTITYTVSDSFGNQAIATRTVNVSNNYFGVGTSLAGPFSTPQIITVNKPLPKGTTAYTIQFDFKSTGSARNLMFVGWASSLSPQQMVTINTAPTQYFQHNHYAQTPGTDDQQYNGYNITSTVFDGNWHTIKITKGNGSPATGKLFVDGVLRDTVSLVGPINMTDTTSLYIGNGSIYNHAAVSLNSGSYTGEEIRNVVIKDKIEEADSLVYSNYTSTSLTAPSGMITTTNALPGPNDDYTIKVSIKFPTTGRRPYTIVVYYGPSSAGVRDNVGFGFTAADKIAAIHYFDDHIITTDLTGLLDGQFHTLYSIFKHVNGTRKSFIYVDGTLLGSTTLIGPTNLTQRNQLWVGNGFAGSNTSYNFDFGEIKDLYIYDAAFYPGSTAPPGWT